jgi:hypothetical protein
MCKKPERTIVASQAEILPKRYSPGGVVDVLTNLLYWQRGHRRAGSDYRSVIGI